MQPLGIIRVDPAPDLIDRRHEQTTVIESLEAWAVVIAQRFGIDRLEVEIERSSAPGGDADNAAHTHGSDDLRHFDISIAADTVFPSSDARKTLIHELLHVAFRHVAAVAKHVEPGPAKAWLTQAIEEDTEALAEALERWIDR